MQRKLLLSATALALTAGMASSALAFDRSKWEWELDADTEIDVDVDVDIKIDPAGATIVEIDQDFKGDLEANAVVIGVVNDPDTDSKHGGHHGWGGWNNEPDVETASIEPTVDNVAAAIGNSASIESQVSVQADIDQKVSDNDWHGEAEFDANAVVGLVFNASVDNTAQVVGNSVSITLDPSATGESGLTTEVGSSYNPCRYGHYGCGPNPDQGDGVDTDNFLMANINQSANFDGTANALVFGVFASDLGGVSETRPLVNNAAIAVGNTASITVLDGSLADALE